MTTMGFKGIKCPKGDVVPGKACFECALNNPDRKCFYPSWLIAEVIPGFKNGEVEGWDELRESYSPTSLAGCKRQIALRRIFDYTVDPSAYWPMVRGNAFHRMAEAAWKPDYIEREIKVSRLLDLGDGHVVDVHGKADEYNSKTHHLIDVKTVKYLSMGLRADAKPEWLAQLSMYKWLLHPDRPVDSAEIQSLDMTRLDRRTYKLWELEKTEEWMHARAKLLWPVYNEDRVPPVIPASEQWRCRNCFLREQCVLWAREHGEEEPQ